MEAIDARPRISRAALAVPLATGALLLLHPPDPVDPFELRDRTSVWLTVHLGLLVAVPALAGVIIWSVAALDGLAAAITRVAAVAMAAWYAAFDALMGIATGVLVREASAIDADSSAGAENLVAAWWGVPAPIPIVSVAAIAAWVLAAGGAAIAHRNAGSPAVTVWGFAAAAVVFGLGGHPGIVGAIGMVALAVALAPLATGRRSDRVAAVG
ncbi:MAG TPA: hypothetical protein VLA82_06840 [Actinomycetota bacterium]|nr:hypothetical protein [Actinomycetota bacterium]